jgi:20S proteasome alpha/beta subunit
VKALIQKVLSERKRELCEEYIQGRFAISYENFLANGKNQLPSPRFEAAVRAIENITLGVEFLITGYASTFPLIIETDQYGKTYIRESFATIGEGGHLAHSSLMHRQYDEMRKHNAAVYMVYEAKKWAERNRTVGNHTAMQVFHRNGTFDYLQREGLDLLEGEFKKYGPKPINVAFDYPAATFNTDNKMTV